MAMSRTSLKLTFLSKSKAKSRFTAGNFGMGVKLMVWFFNAFNMFSQENSA